VIRGRPKIASAWLKNQFAAFSAAVENWFFSQAEAIFGRPRSTAIRFL